jgi:hypothetical protein
VPDFINIGRFKGLNGVFMGARGWRIRRRRKTIYICWGPVEVRNRYPRQFTWGGKTEIDWTESSVEAAKEEVRRRIAEKQSEHRPKGDKPYRRLPPGQGIRESPRRSK